MTIIRFAKEYDATVLPEIERSSGEIFRQVSALKWVADDNVQSEEHHRTLIANGIAFVVERKGSGIVGFLNAEPIDDALHIWQVAVHADHQGRGLGRRLMEATQQFAIDKGNNALTLTTFRNVPWNELFYQRLGFNTLSCEELSPWLRGVLDAEARAGLPMASRCAMRKLL
ncbi:GNAT family N-acetyltransferase [Ochrobactrum quorumnocens]|uniref:GNAT family N-acetyltransferase n=1 Tax=Ochrobactrum quorumnocens TaxID=271865 RepID=UPI000ACEA151|nr:GNAT family N-acetyltransferase [[Ochrobactrum] quorumnocens]